jgi:glycosyltransferase involved in cell wall biosynthesis
LYDILFISTFIENDYIDKMIGSVCGSDKDVRIALLIVDQTNKGVTISTDSNPNITVALIPSDRLGLSAARNVAIRYAKENGIRSRYVLFPDDDSAFDNIFFDNFRTVTADGGNWIFPVYETGSKNEYRPFRLIEGQPVEKKHFDCALSYNMLITYETLMTVDHFDEKLGVGAKYGSTEDHEFFLRAVQYETFRFTRRLCNYHPAKGDLFRNCTLSKTVKRQISYSKGYYYVLAQYGLYGKAVGTIFRALLASVYFLARGEWKRGISQGCAFFARIWYFVYFTLNRSVR